MFTDKPQPKTKALNYFLIQTTFATAFTYLTSGVFLSGLAIQMDASDVLISYLSIIVNICGILILVFSAFLERFTSRKRLTICLTILSRIATIIIVLIPAFAPKSIRIALFVFVVIVAFTLQAQTTVVLNQWMFSFMDEKKSGRYISLRQTFTLIVTVVLSVASGWWMDSVQEEYWGIAILFLIAFFMSICEIILLIRTPDSEKYRPSGYRCRFRDLVVLPLKNRNFIGFVLYVFLFYLLLYISDSFTMVYIMKYLALPYKMVNAMYLIISLPQIFLLSIWGKISDRLGHRFSLTVSIWLFAGETFFMFFTGSGNWYLFIPVAFFISSVANAGFVIAVFNRRYELIPESNRIVYDNFYTAVIGLGFILGPMIGGAVKSLLETLPVTVNRTDFLSIRTLYIISTVGIILLQIIYLLSQRKRKEESHVKN